MNEQHQADQAQTARQQQPVVENGQQRYRRPNRVLIGDSRELLRGSGRHKNDDTGSPGFVVG